MPTRGRLENKRRNVAGPVRNRRTSTFRAFGAEIRVMSDKDLYSGMIRLHILYHASKGPIFGLSIIEELGRHGYKLSPGTLYPILHGLESKGYLGSTEKREGRQERRFYRATPAGRKALKSAKEKVRELWASYLKKSEKWAFSVTTFRDYVTKGRRHTQKEQRYELWRKSH